MAGRGYFYTKPFNFFKKPACLPANTPDKALKQQNPCEFKNLIICCLHGLAKAGFGFVKAAYCRAG